jgi:uncharacterized protein (DUF169 family)
MSNAADVLKRLSLDHAPVAVGFMASPPAGLSHIDRPLPAGCGYWKHAAEGHAFYTTPSDHENCTVGAFTHGVTLSPAKGAELQALVGTMIELQYLKSDEVPNIPHRDAPMQVVAYSPLLQASFDPDVVIFRGNARQIMIVSEAARAAGLFESGAALGRPACSMIPQAMAAAAGLASVGCIGNRVYTGLADGELYFAVPGKSVAKVVDQLDVMLTANEALESFHKERAAALA